MLQQTQVARVELVFEGFLQRFPDVGSLADASRAEVLRAWGRLGYPRRAVALRRAAAEDTVRVHDGEVPRDPSVLRTLPGIGDYTAAAVASLGFGEPVAAIDTNVRRVWARVDLASEADEVSPRVLGEAATAWLDRRRPSAWNQAVMDLGRGISRPTPHCDVCPLRPWCAFAASGRVAQAVEPSPTEVRGVVAAGPRRGARGTARPLAPHVRRPLPCDRYSPPNVSSMPCAGCIATESSEHVDGALEGRDRGRVSLPD